MKFLAVSVAGGATALALVVGVAGARPMSAERGAVEVRVTYWVPTPQPREEIPLSSAATVGRAFGAPATSTAGSRAFGAPTPAPSIDPLRLPPADSPEPERADAGIDATNIDVMRTHVLALHNQARAAHGLAPFATSPALQIAAQQQAEWLARYTIGELWSLGDRAHAGEGGSSFRERIAAAGYVGQATNESFGAFATPDAAFEWWLGDPWHRPQIVSASYSELGIGIAPHSSGMTTVFIVTYGGS